MDVLNLNKQKITHIVIFIFILLSLIYLYNMNMIPSHTNTNTTKTISEKFMVISEDQDLGTNNVSIVNLNQVNFVAGSENISFPDPNMTWPVTLQDLFDTKLNNSGVIGLDLPTGHTPLQGIVLRDLLAKKLVVLGDNVSSTPTTATSINDTKIQFGGPNAGREVNSASIKVNVSGDNINALCILGMSMGTDSNTRKIKMFAEGGLNIYGPTTVGGATNINGELGTQSTIRKTRGNNANLHIVSDKALYLMSKDNVIIYKCTSDCANWDNAGGNLVVENNLKVDGTTTVSGKTNANGGLFTPYLQCNNTNGSSPGVGYFNGIQTGWLEASSTLTVTGASKLNGGLTVSGALSCAGLTATTGSFSGALSCAGLTATTGSFSGALSCAGLTAEGGRQLLHSTGDHIFLIPKTGFKTIVMKSGDWGSSGDLEVQGNLNVNGMATFAGAKVNREFTVDKTVTFSNDNDTDSGGASYMTTFSNRRQYFFGNGDAILSYKGGDVTVASNFGGTGNFRVQGTTTVNVLNVEGLLRTSSIVASASDAVIRMNNQVELGNNTLKFGNGYAVWEIVANGPIRTKNNLNVEGRIYGPTIDGINGKIDAILAVLGTNNELVRKAGAVGANIIDSSSDIRLKENIKNINQNEKDKVLQLVSKTYNFISNENKDKRYGLIAQEVEELYPELVSIDDKGMKALKYIDIIPLLIEHIKDLKKSIPNPNVINIGGVTLTSTELYKLKQLLNNF